MLNLTTAVASASSAARGARNPYPSIIQLCRIEKVDTKRKLLKIYIFDSKMYREDVPYMFSYTDGTNGIFFAPKVGSLGVIVKDSSGIPFVIGFTIPVMSSKDGVTRDMPHLGDHNAEELAEGEILLVGSGGSRIKLDGEGGARFSSSTLDYVNLLPDGHIEVEAAKDVKVSVGDQQIILNSDKMILKGNVEVHGTFTTKEV